VRKAVGLSLFILAVYLLTTVNAIAADTIRIAYIDPLSGAFANVGEQGVKHFQDAIKEVNDSGGVLNGKKLELVTFDNKTSPQESLLILRQVVDQGIHFITQGNGSHVAGALSEGVAKINSRTPDDAIIYLNYAAIDPALTNEKCNFAHFRFDFNTQMKIKAIANYFKDRKDIKKVYIIGQDYAHGHAVSRFTKEYLKETRPDIEIVGDDLHPIGKVKDFSPYVAKIQASGADAVVTGNWGNDMTLLIKAGKDTGLDVDWFTFYAGGLGSPPSIGEAGIGKVYQVTEYHTNVEDSKLSDEFVENFWQKYETDFYYHRIRVAIQMWAKAIDKAGSTDPFKVAKALEGMKYDSSVGEVRMRAEDHQLIAPIYISVLTKAGEGTEYKHDVEDSGLGFKTVAKIPNEEVTVPTSCKMERP